MKDLIFTTQTIEDLIVAVQDGEISTSQMADILNARAEEKIKAWERYVEAYERWRETKYLDDMDRSMSRPNKPGYYRANND